MSGAWILLAALAPAASAAEPLTLGGAAEPGGTIVGRVCADVDGDGRCGPGEPGVAGARVFTAAGQVAVADAAGRYHLLDVPARALAGDRLAYGGQRVAVEGLGARRLVDLAPGGAAQVDLAVPAPAAAAPPLEPAVLPGVGPRRAGGRLLWPLSGRTAPGARVALGSSAAVAGGDGTFTLEVPLSPGTNDLGLTISAPDGRAGVFRWRLHLAAREAFGDLVLPGRPSLDAAFGVRAGAGGVLVHGTAAPRSRVLAAGVVAEAEGSGAFAAWIAGPAARVELSFPARDGAGPPPVALEGPPAGPRRLEAAGLAEVEVAFGGDPGVLVSGRGTGAVRGALGPVAVEAGVDLDDRDRKLADAVHPRDALTHAYAPVPARSFLTAGDAAAVDDRNTSRGRLWARLRGPGLSLDLGGTRAALGGGELGRYDRALFGARAEVARGVGPLRLEGAAFGATLRHDARGNVPPRPARDAFAAHGGAFYWLSSGAIVAGSAAARAEWRDPFTGLLTASRALVRGVDYELDEVSGRLALAQPLPSVAPPAAVETGAPTLGAQATLIVDYLRAAAGPGAEDLSGGRAALSAGPLALEARAAREDRPGGGYRLEGAAATLQAGFGGLRAEVARSTGLPGGAAFARSWNGGSTLTSAAAADGSGEAVHLEGRLELSGASLRGWWRERSAGYADGGFEEAADARERGASLGLEAGALGGLVLWAERRGTPLAEPGLAGAEDVRRAVARGRWRGERLELVGEVVDAERRGAFRGEETSAGARAILQVDPRLALDLSHHQGLRTAGAGIDPTFTAAGASLEVAGAALRVRGGWGPELGARLTASGERARGGEAVYGTFSADPGPAGDLGVAPIGGEAGSTAALGARRRAGGTEVFTEERAGEDALGQRTGRVVGLAVEPARGLRLAVSGERGLRRSASGALRDREALAASAGLVLGSVSLGARGELRSEGDGRLDAAGVSVLWRAAPRLTLSARGSFAAGDLGGARSRLVELSGGGALRLGPGALLATVTRLEERRPGALEREGVLGRLAATAEVGGRLSLGAAAGIAVQRVAGAEDDRLSGSLRAAVRVAGPVDVGAEVARRGPLGGGDVGARSAVRAELGVRLGAPTEGAAGRIALGYHLVGFTGDGLAPDEETGRLFLRAQLTY